MPPFFPSARDPAHLRALLRRLLLRSYEGRIAQYEGAIARRQQTGPFGFQRIAMDDVRRLLKRYANEGLAELQAQPVVHDVVHHPQRGLRDAGRELAKLDPVELVHVDHRLPRRIEHRLTRRGGRIPDIADDLDFQQPQFPVGDDEEVAAAACGVEERQAAEILLKSPKLGNAAAILARLHPVELSPQVVHEQRLDHLEDVLLRRVVRALGAACHGVHDRLEQRAENRGARVSTSRSGRRPAAPRASPRRTRTFAGAP